MANLTLTNGASAFPAEAWFQSVPLDTPSQTGRWPWVYLEINRWIEMRNRLALPFLKSAVFYISYIFFILGIIGCVLTVLVIISMNKRMNSFYIVMIVIACSDFSDFVFVILQLSKQMIAQFGGVPSTAIMAYYGLASALGYTASLFSDMITVCLMVERFLAIVHPLFHRSINAKQRNDAWWTAMFISTLISLTRAHYGFSATYFSRNANIENSWWFKSVSFFSDIIIPFAITFFTLFLVAGISKALYTRRKQKIENITAVVSNAGSHTQTVNNANINENKLDRGTRKTLSLLASLYAMFFLNQLNYISFAITVILRGKTMVTYFSNYNEIEKYVWKLEIFTIMAFTGRTAELASRALVFYAYIIFNKEFRNDTVKWITKWYKKQTMKAKMIRVKPAPTADVE